MFGKSICVNLRGGTGNEKEAIQALNEGEKTKNAKDVLISGYNLSVTEYYHKDSKLAKEKLAPGLIIGKKRAIVQISPNECLILYRKRPAPSQANMSTILSSGAKKISKEKRAVFRCKSIAEYVKNLVKQNSEYAKEIENLHEDVATQKSVAEKTLEDCARFIKGSIQLGQLLIAAGSGKGLQENDIAECKEILTNLAEEMKQREIHGGMEYDLQTIIAQVENIGPLCSGPKQVEKPNKHIEEEKLEWEVAVDSCKKCDKSKEVIKYFKNCSRTVCKGINQCRSCLKTSISCDTKSIDNGACESCGQLLTLLENKTLKGAKYAGAPLPSSKPPTTSSPQKETKECIKCNREEGEKKFNNLKCGHLMCSDCVKT